MRVLFVVSTLVLAVTSLAAVTLPATLATDSPLLRLIRYLLGDPDTGRAADGIADGTAQIPSSTDVENFVDIINAALAGLNDPSCSSILQINGAQVNSDQLLKCISAIENTVGSSVEKLKTVHKESRLTESDMAALIPTVFGFITTLSTFLVGLIRPVVGALTGSNASKILDALDGLLNYVSELVDVMKSSIVDPHAQFLAPIFMLIESIVKDNARLFGFKNVW